MFFSPKWRHRHNKPTGRTGTLSLSRSRTRLAKGKDEGIERYDDTRGQGYPHRPMG